MVRTRSCRLMVLLALFALVGISCSGGAKPPWNIQYERGQQWDVVVAKSKGPAAFTGMYAGKQVSLLEKAHKGKDSPKVSTWRFRVTGETLSPRSGPDLVGHECWKIECAPTSGLGKKVSVRPGSEVAEILVHKRQLFPVLTKIDQVLETDAGGGIVDAVAVDFANTAEDDWRGNEDWSQITSFEVPVLFPDLLDALGGRTLSQLAGSSADYRLIRVRTEGEDGILLTWLRTQRAEIDVPPRQAFCSSEIVAAQYWVKGERWWRYYVHMGTDATVEAWTISSHTKTDGD